MKTKSLLAIALTYATISVASANSWTAIAQDPSLPLPTGGSAPPAPLGSLTLFTDEASFLAAAPGVVTEDFETNQVADNNVATCTEPVSSASNDVCFMPSDLLDGFSITSSDAMGVVLLTTGFLGAPSDIVGANNFPGTTLIDFNPPVTALGMEVFAGLAAGDVQITYLDGGGATIGTATATGLAALPDSQYLGVVSPAPIASIEINSMVDNGELIDNMSYGSAGPPPVIPTLSIAGLAALALGLVALAVFAMRRRTHRDQA